MARITKSAHRDYISSAEWRERREVHLREFPVCGECEMPRWLSTIAYDQDLHVHHVNYQRVGEELPEDLRTLCPRCHEVETFGRSELRQPKTATCEECGRVHWDYRANLCIQCHELEKRPSVIIGRLFSSIAVPYGDANRERGINSVGLIHINDSWGVHESYYLLGLNGPNQTQRLREYHDCIRPFLQAMDDANSAAADTSGEGSPQIEGDK